MTPLTFWSCASLRRIMRRLKRRPMSCPRWRRLREMNDNKVKPVDFLEVLGCVTVALLCVLFMSGVFALAYGYKNKVDELDKQIRDLDDRIENLKKDRK